MDFKCITSQIKSQETLNKLHNENAWGSMLTRGIPTYNNQQKAHKIDVHFFLYYKCALPYFPSNEKWWKSEAYSNVDLKLL